jgi:hypothetical protein
MKYLVLLLTVFVFLSCENHAFDRDKRQILAKDEVRRLMQGNRSITITGFREDTLPNWPDSIFRHPIRYTLDFKYNDSTGAVKNKEGVIIFSQQGNAIIDYHIIDH